MEELERSRCVKKIIGRVSKAAAVSNQCVLARVFFLVLRECIATRKKKHNSTQHTWHRVLDKMESGASLLRLMERAFSAWICVPRNTMLREETQELCVEEACATERARRAARSISAKVARNRAGILLLRILMLWQMLCVMSQHQRRLNTWQGSDDMQRDPARSCPIMRFPA